MGQSVTRERETTRNNKSIITGNKGCEKHIKLLFFKKSKKRKTCPIKVKAMTLNIWKQLLRFYEN